MFEEKLHKYSDSEVLHKAAVEGRVLLTMDLDFARLIAKADTTNLPTVIIFRLSNQRPHSIQARLNDLMPIIEKSLEQGSSIFSVSDQMVRVRETPIK